MSEKKFMNILRRACDKQVKVRINTTSNSGHQGHVVEIGDDYVKIKWSLKENYKGELFIKLSSIESISTSWREKKL